MTADEFDADLATRNCVLMGYTAFLFLSGFPSMSSTAPGYWALLRLTGPFILANISVPLLGLADTAVIGHFGLVTELGALAIGGIVFNFAYWAFGFLRMGTSGLIAQAYGAEDYKEAQRIFVRSAILALGFALLLVVAQRPLFFLATALIDAPHAVNSLVEPYFFIRIWGAPATLFMYVISGVFIALSKSQALLYMQLGLNGLNIALNLLFAGVLGWGIEGIAWGTLIAEYSTLVVVFVVFFRTVRPGVLDLSWKRIFVWQKFRKLLLLNSDILIRTVCLLFSFAWFTHMGATFGEVTLAANHILLQLISFSAFFLDGFAYVVEGQIGQAIGARSKKVFYLGVWRTSVLAVITALILAIVIYLYGIPIIQLLTDLAEVSRLAGTMVPFVAMYVFLAVVAFQLDGIFIGASYSSAMRNCSLIASLFFLSAWYAVFYRWDNSGLWWAFITYVIVRGVSLLLYFPALIKRSF